jgi:diacylglycerol kinase (ATP)
VPRTLALIVNPFAGRGRARARAAEVERILTAQFNVKRYDTAAAGDERRCARQACDDGAEVVAIVGGDGSVHHTARGLLDDAPVGEPTSVPLAIFAAGTGNDFVKSLGAPAHDVQAMSRCLALDHTRCVDVGLIDGVPFLNAAGLGFDVEVLERLQQVKRLTGTAAYVITALRALLGYRGYHAELYGVGTRYHGTHLLTVFANGRTFGGAFHIAPHASLDDGQLALVNIGALSPLARPRAFLQAMRGTHLAHPAVSHETGVTFTIIAANPLCFEADGELYQARHARIEVAVRPRALRVIS